MAVDYDVLAQKLDQLPQRLEKRRRGTRSDGSSDNTELALQVECVADVEERPLQPLWPGVLWLGKQTLLAGDPGLGKSQLACDITARVTRGTDWPAGEKGCGPADVFILSAEDAVADTIRPRLIAAGADLSRVHCLSSVLQSSDAEDGREVWLSLMAHTSQIESQLAGKPDARLIVIDPITAYLDGSDSNNISDIRSVLARTARLAAERNVAVLAITHLNKSSSASALQRVIGSTAFVAACRAVFVIAKDQSNPSARLMMPVKNNLARCSESYRYEIAEAQNGAPYIHWAGTIPDVDVDAMLAPPRQPSSRASATTARTETVQRWLSCLLEEGPQTSSTIKDNARSLGYSDRQLDRACKILGVRKEARGFQGSWIWSLPESDTSPTTERVMETG